MNRRGIGFLIGAALTSFLLIVGWHWAMPITAQANPTLLISAAASLQDALEAIDPLFEQKYTDIKVNYNFGSSGALQRQIEQGAPTDVFIAAATKQMDALQKANLLLPNSRRNLLSNRLVLVAPQSSTLKLNRFQQLADPMVKRISVGEFRSVPAGQYAEEVFKSLGILNQVKPKLVFANTVRGVLAVVESRNVDVGVVYETDAKISQKVKIMATAPNQSHSPIVYPIGILKSSQQLNAAKDYAKFLQGSQAKSVFQKYGFRMAS